MTPSSALPAPSAAEPVDPAEVARVMTGLAARGIGRMVPDRERITALLDLLGDPQRSFRSVHITGTNGKTSTARVVDSLLRAHGLRVGRYTSPHLQSPVERISLDGAPLGLAAFVRAYDDVAPYAELLDARAGEDAQPVTYFELMTAMAFAAFADAPVDVAVIEVGMGGEWDATNVVDAGVCVLTPVTWDHPELGPDLAAKAREKSGIVHAGAVLVSAAQDHEVLEVLAARMAEVGARLVLAQGAGATEDGAWSDGEVERGGVPAVLRREVAVGGQLLTLRGLAADYAELVLPLHGAHQAENALLALVATEVLLGGGEEPLDVEVVREAFADVTAPGRLEVARTGPTVLLDGAHNPAGAKALAVALGDAFTFTRLVGVVAVLGDKDAAALLEALEPALDEIVVTQSASPRAMPADELAEIAAGVFGESRVTLRSSLDDALDTATGLAEAEGGPGSGVVVTGSLTLVGEARALLGGVPA